MAFGRGQSPGADGVREADGVGGGRRARPSAAGSHPEPTESAKRTELVEVDEHGLRPRAVTRSRRSPRSGRSWRRWTSTAEGRAQSTPLPQRGVDGLGELAADALDRAQLLDAGGLDRLDATEVLDQQLLGVGAHALDAVE